MNSGSGKRLWPQFKTDCINMSEDQIVAVNKPEILRETEFFSSRPLRIRVHCFAMCQLFKFLTASAL